MLFGAIVAECLFRLKHLKGYLGNVIRICVCVRLYFCLSVCGT